ncbi:hypothetical protein BC629DRAFT_23279 [Irpex lacteus]|nr:hypothetical protein BC629DRAFT_23279 [Irpex lacteus]
MESAYANLGRKGATLYSDRSMRLRERPQATGFEDLGSDFVHGKSGEAGKGVRGGGNMRSGRNSRGGSVEMVAVKKPKLTPLEDDSDDELNIISAEPSKTGSSNKKLTSEGSLDSTGFNADGTMIDGQFYPWDKDTIRIQEHSTNLKAMKFKKNSRSAETSAANSTSATPPSTRHNSLARSSRTATKAASAPFKPPTVTRSSGGQRSALGSSSKLTQDHEKQKGQPEDKTATPRPNTRPKARPAYKVSKPEPQRSTRQSKKDIAPFPMQGLSPLKETSNAPSKGKSRGWGSSSDDDSDATGSGKGKGKATIRAFPMQYSPVKPKEAQPFPLSPPRKSQMAKGRVSQDSQLEPDSSPLSSPESVQERFPATAPTIPSKPLAAFPVLSPLSSPVRPKESKKFAAFPVPSPFSSPDRPEEPKKQADHPSQGRPKRRAAMASRRVIDTESDEDSEEEIPRPPPRRKKKKPDIKPFPMETQMLESIDRAEYGSLDGVQIVSSDEEEMRYERRVRGGEEILREIMRSEDMSGSDEESKVSNIDEALFMLTHQQNSVHGSRCRPIVIVPLV